MIVGRVLAVACVVALLGAAVAIGIVWGWAGSGSQGHRALASDASAPAAPRPASTPAPSNPSSTAAPSQMRPTSTPAPLVASPSSPDWLSVVGALDRSRDIAFADADANELDAIYVPGSAALATDRATLGQLVGAGQRVAGLQFTLESVRVVSQSPSEVTLTVVDTLAAYDVVDAGGTTAHVPGRGVRTWTLRLRAQPAGVEGWQIASVAPG